MRIIDSELYEKFCQSKESENLRKEERDFLASIASISPFAYRILTKQDLNDFLKSYSIFPFDKIKLEINGILKSDEESFLKNLKEIKYRELLKILVRDVLLDQDILVTLQELSLLADLIIQGIYDFTAPTFSKKVDNPICLIAMGKLGSRELNFSSDIDIMYVHDTDNIDFEENYNKWALKINRMLSHYNQDGFLYRVDNDIRPGGKYSPLSMSVKAVTNFYTLYGETWQRVALLRARLLCGRENIFESLFSELEQYIYRKYVDFTMVNELRELKLKINRESLARDLEGRNIKLGMGGIREIEFFVQTLQIMFGGKNKKLRVPYLVDAIKALNSENIIDNEEAEKLIKAYKFLRKVENAIQMEEEQQVYMLPSDNRKLLMVAKRVGYDVLDRFLEDLDFYRKFVNKMFSQLLGERQDISSFKGIENSLELEKLIFNIEQKVNLSKENINDLIKQIDKLPSKYKEPYCVVIKELIVKLSDYEGSEDLMNKLTEFMKVLVRKPVYLSLLAENKRIIEMLIHFFSAGPFLGKILINSPETLDFLLIKDDIRRDNWFEYYKMTQSLLSGIDDFEIQMKIIRQYKNSEWLKIGMLFSNNIIGIQELELYLTNLAEACLISVINLCKNIVNQKIPEPYQDIAVIGMGKLGSKEMNYFSDLDLIFLYRSEDENAGYFNTKLLQKVISSLTIITEEGSLYEVDMRLRPTGSQGPLVTTFNNFREYHLKSSWLFEKQALTRARILGEENEFKKEIEGFIDEILYSKPFDDTLLKKEILEMRKKMEDELAVKERSSEFLEIKYGQGGITDIEFIIQYLKLRYGAIYKSLQVKDPYNFFKNLSKIDIFDGRTIEEIERNYIFLKKVDMALRLILGYSKHSIRIGSDLISNIAVFMGYKKGQDRKFLEDLKKIKKDVRKKFLKIING
ncbi:MAG: bifunctional [glutamate--ammonia ligase]-adenylyl-L-tyrosine phosphorylase/[glutamate--ammonia-ligase] adenylyltransferase [Proteobacteria bacterium]|nr:bifunctional [glutamate--ammonia ligase]-adenylyl-L-tyrosine phosphorylase/[glutamate--ammonia-ligase] adenylyltransferase [Pseudomonadota bacterium]